MNKDTNRQPDPGRGGETTNRVERDSSVPNDLPDSEKDRRELKSEEQFIDLPDVKDIPGQEFVHVPPAGEMGDTTIASDDEEGRSVFDTDSTELVQTGNNADVSRGERSALNQIDYMPTRDEDRLYEASMDSTDFQGTPLNEGSFGEERTGSDLDVPGSELDNRDENIGEEDEENNDYSLGSSDNDNVTEGTP